MAIAASAAATNLMGTCTCLLVLILCHEAIYVVEGRHLKPKLCKKCSRRSESSLDVSKDGHHNTTTHLLNGDQEKISKMDFVDDFRPTAPGHSPGVGHSIQN
ncbi:conserved hypothetical protein [Ricinus communis]|uniref:Uncharacterized protein n=1 Tax=Ricinus communis TaxID=3988 RepID=B9S8I9_RICCO|nr:conserved hypothetical protein [Ricinus communis]